MSGHRCTKKCDQSLAFPIKSGNAVRLHTFEMLGQGFQEERRLDMRGKNGALARRFRNKSEQEKNEWHVTAYLRAWGEKRNLGHICGNDKILSPSALGSFSPQFTKTMCMHSPRHYPWYTLLCQCIPEFFRRKSLMVFCVKSFTTKFGY